MNAYCYVQKLLWCCYSTYTCQPAQNEVASWSTLVPGHGQAENTYEMTHGTKAIYVHEQEVLGQPRHSFHQSVNRSVRLQKLNNSKI